MSISGANRHCHSACTWEFRNETRVSLDTEFSNRDFLGTSYFFFQIVRGWSWNVRYQAWDFNASGRSTYWRILWKVLVWGWMQMEKGVEKEVDKQRIKWIRSDSLPWETVKLNRYTFTIILRFRHILLCLHKISWISVRRQKHKHFDRF